MATLRQKIKELEEDAALVDIIRERAKTPNGINLSEFGQDMVLVFKNAGFQNSEIAKILDVTPPAITNQVAKLKK